MSKKYLMEVRSKIRGVQPTPREKAQKRKSIYNTQLKVIGLTIPELKNINKVFSFYEKKPQQILKIWDYIWKNSQVFEEKIQAILYYEKKMAIITYDEHWSTFASWLNGVDNWEHSDRLSRFYSHLLEKFPKNVYPTLKEWNKSENPWFRRQSIVSLVYYSSIRKTIIVKNKIFPLIKKLLKDDDYYVQKGIGWSLREVGNVYPTETIEFIEKNLKDISSIAFSPAVEKVSSSIKNKLKEQRRNFRKQSK
ncbi:DNA alkylation repair protein [Candidatus Uabimicrobium sp. HlEnr_7]|uniref:DNA alkylation repair protein n=1 Tax=Candidatus Uabimicrobium helgolandensis TaxID=3095367 RepID=UPI0035580B25